VAAHEFRAVIQANDSGGAWVDIPFDVERVFGRKRVPVLATIDGEAYRGSLVRMGGACHMLLVRKDVREKIGKSAGDEVHVTLRLDDAPRVVDVPPDLRAALAARPAAAAFFDGLSYTHQREYVSWILEAKRDQTRIGRIEKAVRMLEEQKKTR
jgi:hypothetical protein